MGMRPASPRKLTILDAMILVAAVACGLAMSRTVDPGGASYSQNWFGRITDGPVRVSAALPYLIALTPAVMLMRIRRPRPRWRRLMRQPGMAACSVAMVPIVVALLRLACREWPPQAPYPSDFDMIWDPLYWDCAFDAGLWVLAAWLALALSGRRRSEPSGIDRLGRLVGAGWLMVLAVRLLGMAHPG